MNKFALFLSFNVVLFLVACGGNNMVTNMVGPPMMSGNFSLTATSQTVSNMALIGGALQSDPSGNVTATMHAIDASFPCLNNLASINFTGTVNSQGHLSLASSSLSGQTMNITAMVSSDGKTISNGTYTTSGTGCLPAGDHGTLSGSAVQLMAGTYSGSFMLNGNTVTAALTIKQTPPFGDGTFPVSVSGAFSNTGVCAFTTSGSEGGSQTGLFVITDMVTNGGPTTLGFSGFATEPTAKTINGFFSMFGGACDQTVAQVTLTAP